ncbi:hypothetical protein LXL04_000468 [Taraxacum kok-saghyz]
MSQRLQEEMRNHEVNFAQEMRNQSKVPSSSSSSTRGLREKLKTHPISSCQGKTNIERGRNRRGKSKTEEAKSAGRTREGEGVAGGLVGAPCFNLTLVTLAMTGYCWSPIAGDRRTACARRRRILDHSGVVCTETKVLERVLSATWYRLYLRKKAIKNSFVRTGKVEGDLEKRALAYSNSMDYQASLGLRRRPYFIFAGLIGSIAMLVPAFTTNLSLVWAILSFMTASAGVAIADVTIDACVTENSISHPSLAGDMQSLCGISSSIGQLVGFAISGVLVHIIGPQGVFGVLSIPAGLVILVGFMLEEPLVHGYSHKRVSQKFLDAVKRAGYKSLQEGLNRTGSKHRWIGNFDGVIRHYCNINKSRIRELNP